MNKSFLVACLVFRSFYGAFIRVLKLLSTRFWTIFGGFGQIQKSKMADQDGCHSEKITQLLRQVTSSPHDSDVKKDISRRTIYSPNFFVIAFIFSELPRGGGGGVVEDQEKPCLNRVKLIKGWIVSTE